MNFAFGKLSLREADGLQYPGDALHLLSEFSCFLGLVAIAQ